MALIRVTASELRKQASELRNLNGQFKQNVGSLESQEAELKTQWEGEANEAFHAAFTSDKTQMDNFYNLIEQYCTTLENIAAQYEKAEAANAERAAQRTY